MMCEYEGYAIVELMGHRKRAGYIKEVDIAGGKMIRIDIPVSGGITEFYGSASIYSIRPSSEEIVEDFVKHYGEDPRPVRPVEYRKNERPAISHEDTDDEEDELF